MGARARVVTRAGRGWVGGAVRVHSLVQGPAARHSGAGGMGACSGKSREAAAEENCNADVDKKNKADADAEASKIKLLLLGAAHRGPCTALASS